MFQWFAHSSDRTYRPHLSLTLFAVRTKREQENASGAYQAIPTCGALAFTVLLGLLELILHQ
jgi:hypothetical protein